MMSFVELVNEKATPTGVTTISEWFTVGLESHAVGVVLSVEVEAHVVRGATEPMITVFGVRGFIVLNWEHVVGVTFQADETQGLASAEGDEAGVSADIEVPF